MRHTAFVIMLSVLSEGAPTAPGQTDPPHGRPAARAPAQDAEPTPNAALIYNYAWLGQHEDGPAWVRNAGDPAWRPDREQAALLEASQEHIDRLLRATEIERCDFGAPWRAEGVEGLLPHITPMRKSARLLIADARRLAADRRQDAASDRLIAALAIAHHLTQDGEIISGLTAASIAKLIRAELAIDGLDEITPDHAAMLRERLDRFGAADPLGLRAGVAAQAAAVRKSAVMTLAGDEVEAGGMRGMRLEQDARRWMSGHAVKALLAEAEAWPADILAAWDAPDAEAKLGAIDQAVQRGDYGRLGRIGYTSTARLKAKETEAVRTLDAIREALPAEEDAPQALPEPQAAPPPAAQPH